MSICLWVCLSLCSLLRYRLNVFLPPLPYYGIGATIRIGREIFCLSYAGFFWTDHLKIIYFLRSEFSLIKFCAKLCAEIAFKNIKFFFIPWANSAKIMKKFLFCKFCVENNFFSSCKFKKILCGHAIECPCVLEALLLDYAYPNDSLIRTYKKSESFKDICP